MISTSNPSVPRAARAPTSFCGAAQPEPTNTRIPLRRCSSASSGVVQRLEWLLPSFTSFRIFIIARNLRQSPAAGYTFFGRSLCRFWLLIEDTIGYQNDTEACALCGKNVKGGGGFARNRLPGDQHAFCLPTR